MLHPALVVLWMGLSGLAFAPGAVLAQTEALAERDRATLARLTEQDQRYDRWEAEYEAALAALRVAESLSEAALDSVTTARQSGDQQAYDRASESQYLLSQDWTRADRRVQQVSDSLRAARSEYLAAMDERLTVLLELQESALTRADVERYDVLIEDLGNRYRELEDSSDILTPQPLVMQGVLAYSPRDTPSRLRNKIEIADRRIGQVEEGIEEADERISGIEQRIRTQRQQENFRTTLGRFDDTRVPVGPPGQSRSQGDQAVSDTTGVRTVPESLADQLEGWQTLRGQLEAMLEGLKALREELESHLGAEPMRRPAGQDGGRTP